MAKKNNFGATSDGLLGMLGPTIERAVQEESGRVLAELEAMIATRVRDQLLWALQDRLAGKAPNQVVREPVEKKPAVKARKAAKAPSAPAAAADGKACNVRGCDRPHRSVGYCSSHYQSSRKYGWPSPCPPDFDPPVRPRGRPPKAKPAFAELFETPATNPIDAA